MGSLFRQPGVESRSVLSGPQQGLLDPLASFARGGLSSGTPGYDQLLSQLLGANSDQARTMSERIFNEALLGPASRAYERDVAPRVAGDFAGIGGTLSSRRDETLTRGRTDVIKGAESSLASILPQIESFPLQQTLAQIQGLGGLESTRYLPYEEALKFAIPPTQQNVQTPGGVGWGLLGSALGIGGFALGGGFGGHGGGGGGGSSGWNLNTNLGGARTSLPGVY